MYFDKSSTGCYFFLFVACILCCVVFFFFFLNNALGFSEDIYIYKKVLFVPIPKTLLVQKKIIFNLIL
jgi:hypothetical protein